VAGEDEARAQDVLAEMQVRISQGPESALGLGDAFSPEDVRAAFLALTKQFHPARFGRLSPELRAMSNEVFLGIKAAHEQLLKILGVATKPTGSARSTGCSRRISCARRPCPCPCPCPCRLPQAGSTGSGPLRRLSVHEGGLTGNRGLPASGSRAACRKKAA
jgi:hypothetical protein